jgi:hypothetical protein
MAANVIDIINQIIREEMDSISVEHKEARDTQRAYKNAGKKYKFNFDKELRKIPINKSTPELESVVVNLFKLIRLGEIEGKEQWYRVLSDKNLVRVLMQDFVEIIEKKKNKSKRNKSRKNKSKRKI